MTSLLDRSKARWIIRNGYEIGPRMHPCSCGAPRHAHAGAKFQGANPDSGCRRYRRDNADVLAERAMEADRTDLLDDIVAWHTTMYPRPVVEPGGYSVGPSDTGTCRRAIQYRERPPEGLTLNEVDESAATLGSIFHDVVRRARQHLYQWRKYEFEVTVPGLDRPGRMDEYDPITATGVDYKTLGEWGWDRLGEDGPREEHFEQLAVYCFALIAAGKEVDVMRIIYLRRATGESEYHDRPYDEDYARKALGNLTAIMLALDMGQELPRDGRGPSSDPICAKYCKYRDFCWNVPAAEAAGRSPESYTILGAHPAIEDIEWAAEQARTWKDGESEATREYKATIPLLGGIPDGTYGDYVISEQRRLMPKYKEYYETVRRAYEIHQLTPPDQRRDFAEELAYIPLPRRRDVWVQVKRKRGTKSSTPKEVTS